MPAPSSDPPYSAGDAPDAQGIAPPWHTAALISLMLAVAGIGAALASHGVAAPVEAAPRSRLLFAYLPTVVVTWSLLLYVCRIGRPRNELRRLLGEGWRSPGRAGLDIALAFAGWLLVKAVERSWATLFRAVTNASVAAMLPQTWLERIAWVILSVSVGFCEEVVFRGYLQKQLTAFTGRASVGIVLQAALFAIAHGEQGSAAMARMALYGLAFGALARWRRSLLPGIVCHVWTDVASGLLGV